MSAETLAMPFRCEPHAPSFAGDDDEGLLDFVEQFDALADACKLTDDEKCDGILRYVDRPSKQLWLTLAGYELRDYQKFKNDILYQYPVAWKAAQRRAAQPVRHRTPEKIERPAQIVHSPTSNVPASTASYSRLPELSPVLAHSSPAPVSRYVLPVAAPIAPAPVARPVVPVPVRTAPVPVARPVIPVPATVVRNAHAVPAPAARRDLAPPIVRPALAVSAVRLVHASPVIHRAPSRARHVCAKPGPVDRRSHGAPFVRHDHAAPFTFHPAAAPFVPSTARPLPFSLSSHLAPSVSVPVPLPFSLRPNLAPFAPVTARPPPSPITFVPPVCVPAPLPFPLCPAPAPPASVTAHVQPSSVEVPHHAVPSVADCSSHRRTGEEDVAILKEEGRGQQAVVEPNDEKAERHAIDQQRKLGLQQELDEDKPGDTADEDQARRMAGEDERGGCADEERTRRIADEDQVETKQHRQENDEQEQQQIAPMKNLENNIDTLPVPVPVAPPVPELSPDCPAKPDIRLATVPVSPPSPESPSRLAEPQLFPFERITPARIPHPCSQNARLPSFQHVFSQTRIPRSPLPHLRSKDRLACTQHLSSQNRPRSQTPRSQFYLPRAQYKREKVLRQKRFAQPTVISRRNGPLPVVLLFVPPRRNRGYRPGHARARFTVEDRFAISSYVAASPPSPTSSARLSPRLVSSRSSKERSKSRSFRRHDLAVPPLPKKREH